MVVVFVVVVVDIVIIQVNEAIFFMQVSIGTVTPKQSLTD